MFVRILYTNNRNRRQNKWHAIFPIPTAPADATMAVAVTTVQTTAIPTAADATTAITITTPTAVDATTAITELTTITTAAIHAVAVTAAATNTVAAETVKN